MLPTEVLDLLQRPGRFLLSGHEHPDGDCVGSQVGLYHLLRSLGAEVEIFNPDPLARSLRFLAEHTPIGDARSGAEVPVSDVLVLLDCARVGRLGDLGQRIRAHAPKVLVIDHHVGSDQGDGDLCYVDCDAAATGVLVYNLYKALGVEIPQPAAEGIFVSVVSDTGWFRYSNTDPAALRIAAELVARGVRADRVYDNLFRELDPRAVGLLAEGLATHSYHLGGRLACAALPRELLHRISRAGFETDAILEPIRSVTGVEVACLFKELQDGRVKISLRSMGAADVQQIAASFGGGGHQKAAGATMGMSLDAAIQAVTARVAESLHGLEDGEQT